MLRCRHNFRYNSSKFAVNEDFTRVSGSLKRPSRMDKIVIHHYQIKSLEVGVQTLRPSNAFHCNVSCARPPGLLTATPETNSHQAA